MRTIHTAEILCVGTELLLGDIVNTNAAYLSQRLAELGICVYRHTVVGDNPERLRRALDAAFREADLVITSGGLGPTYDDLTKETVADYFGRTMEMHEESLATIRGYFARIGRVMTKNNEKQAMMPVGALVFPNHYGTAPSLALCNEDETRTVIMLPGPPGELCPLFEEQILPYLKKRRDSVLVSKNIHIFGMGESAVEEKLKTLMTESENPTVAPYCKEGEVRLRVTAQSDSEDHSAALCDDMIGRIADTEVGDYIYGIDVGTLEQAVIDALRLAGKTLATAESCTGGLIAKRITDLAGCSDVFLGGCVTYSNEAKERLLGVSHETLERFGAVSEQTAAEMAKGARERLGADVAVSATGIAGPGGGSAEKPVGTVYVGFSTAEGEQVRKLSLSAMRSREYIRIVTANNAYDMILKNEKQGSK
ncbi:MAG: competence/damage-inducible protein A [Clostridia bacterium]|nr:competence/damage-inducible protein A [Clostridia bacterium]